MTGGSRQGPEDRAPDALTAAQAWMREELAGLDRPLYFNSRRMPPAGFAGPKTCHRTSSGIMVHVKPGCRCPRRRR